MFHRDKLNRDGVPANALVLDKKIYASGVETGQVDACRYELRVRFEDGSTTEITRHAFGHTVAGAVVGDVIPVRYDPADRSKIEIDRHAIGSRLEAQERELREQAIARGERTLDSPSAEPRSRVNEIEREPNAGDLRIGDADREQIAHALSRHMTDGRLTVDELDDRLGVLYRSQTRDEARSVLAGLPALGPPADLPAWTTSEPAPARRPSTSVAGAAPTDEQLTQAYEAWRAKVTKAKADKAAHKRAEATGDRKETFLAFRRVAISRAEEKSARAKFDDLHKRRPDWTPAG
jgi:DUF1707 SHOCT-like domain